MDHRHGSHAVFSMHLLLVWITKYRKKVLEGEVAFRFRDMVREKCQNKGVDIIKCHVVKDHIHLFVPIPPQVAVSRLMQKLKGSTSYKILNEFNRLRKIDWDRHFCVQGYFCCSSGNVTNDVITQYIEQQDLTSDDGFKVDGEGEP